MLSNILFWATPVVYSIYLYGITEYFKKNYFDKINDVKIILDRFLILGLFGLLIISLLNYFLLEKKIGFKRVILISGVCAGILIISYYFFVPTAVEMAAWMNVEGLKFDLNL